MPSIPGLNTRETATVVWLLVVAGFVLTKGEVRSAVGQLAKTIFGSIYLFGVIVAAIAYAVGSVLFLNFVGYWDCAMIKTTVYWFLGSALVAIFTSRKDERYFARLLRNNITLAVAVQFIAGLYTFPLIVELVLVPVVTLFVASHALSEVSPDLASARKPLDAIITVLGVVVLTFSLVHIASNLEDAANEHRVREFFLPLLLTLCFVPFLYAIGLFVVYQTMLSMVRYGLRGNEQLYRFARREIFRACGLSLARAQKCESRRGVLWGAEDEAAVTRAMRDIRASF